MFKNDGYSFYGQKMRPNQPNSQPNKNQFPNNNPHSIYQNPHNYQRPNNYPHFQNQNQFPNSNINPNPNQNKFNNINNKPLMKANNKKYYDLEIRPFFRNDNSPSLSSEDLQLKNELDKITNQYMTVFDNINKLSINSSNENDDAYKKLNTIKKEFNQIDYFNANEYSNFIGQLYEVSKDGNVLNLGYDSFKKNNKEPNEEIKNIIKNFKYDIVLYKNKNNTTHQNYQRLNDYINKKRQNNNNFIKNNSNDYNYNKNFDYNPNENLIDNEDGSIGNEFNLLKDSNMYSKEKPKYEDPNDISDYNNFNLFDSKGQNKKDSELINVKFIIDGNESYHEVNLDESGEVLHLIALQEKDNPKIYTKNGRCLNSDLLLKTTVREIFEGCEYVLNVY